MKFNLSFMVLSVAFLALQVNAGQSSGGSATSPSARRAGMQATSDGLKHTQLLQAARNGNADEVQRLLGEGVPVDVANQRGRTSLMFAAHAGHTEIVQILVAAHASIDARDRCSMTPLMLAVRAGHVEVVRSLINAGADFDAVDRSGETLLIFAAYNGHAKVVQFLVNHNKRSVDRVSEAGMTALMRAAQKGHADVVRVLLNAKACVKVADEKGWTALMFAVHHGHAEIVRILLGAGACVNALIKGRVTALALAANSNHLDVVRTLLAAGATNHAFSMRLALKFAAQNGNDAIVQSLLLTDPSIVDAVGRSGVTALMYAAANDHVACVRKLLNARAQVNFSDKNGNTPLMHAAGHGHTGVVRELLRGNANPHCRNNDRNTAMEIARNNGHGAVASILGREEERLCNILKRYAHLVSRCDEIKLQCREVKELAQSNIAELAECFTNLTRRLSLEERSVAVARDEALRMVKGHDIELTDKILEPLSGNDVHEKFRNELLCSSRNLRQPLAMHRHLYEELEQEDVATTVCEFALSELHQRRLREVLQAEKKRPFNSSHESSRPSKRQRTR